ncbi:MAG: hypothetical protein HQL69_17655 [Magnetococcales bacterium]|nr:hypothetical protein [Magnetococcales bacterium]
MGVLKDAGIQIFIFDQYINLVASNVGSFPPMAKALYQSNLEVCDGIFKKRTIKQGREEATDPAQGYPRNLWGIGGSEMGVLFLRNPYRTKRIINLFQSISTLS